MNQYQLVQKVNDLNDIIQQINSNVQFNITIMWTILGVVAAALGAAVYFLIKMIVNDKVNKEIDKRLIDLMKINTPIFMATGSAIPDENKKIYLNRNIPGIEQLEPDKILILETKSDRLAYGNIEGLNPILRINENGIVEIEIMNYFESNGVVKWRILWPRNSFTGLND